MAHIWRNYFSSPTFSFTFFIRIANFRIRCLQPMPDYPFFREFYSYNISIEKPRCFLSESGEAHEMSLAIFFGKLTPKPFLYCPSFLYNFRIRCLLKYLWSSDYREFYSDLISVEKPGCFPSGSREAHQKIISIFFVSSS